MDFNFRNSDNFRPNNNFTNRSGNLEDQKKKILSFIVLKGPSLPMHISSYLKIDSILSSAFLSDLLSDKELKISNMRVGNSPVYYIPGQENQLERFANFLGGKEKEAFHLLKEHGILSDVLMLPAIRVALRAIKDFSFPLEYNENLYWRYLTKSENESIELIESSKANFSQLPNSYQRVQQNNLSVNLPIPEKTISEDKSITLENKQIINPINEVKPIEVISNLNETKQIEPIFESPVDNIEIKKTQEEVVEKIIEPKIRKLRVIKKSEFTLKVEEFLGKEGIEIVSEIRKGKKEYHALVAVKKEDGSRTEYFCIAKEKKSVSDKELMRNLQIGQRKSLPVLFVTSGEASKKAIEWLDYLGNVIVYKKMD